MRLLTVIRSWLCRLFGGTRLCPRQGDASILLVGMEKSSTYGACPGSSLDVDHMEGVLADYGYVSSLKNGKATIRSVRKALSTALESGFCIFYYSGHGGQEKDPKGEGGVSEFLCLDDGPLHDYEIWDMLGKARGRVMLIFDCCHSGTMYREATPRYPGFSFSLASTRVPGQGWMSLYPMSPSTMSVEDHGLLVWSGCPADEVSYGSPDGGVLTNGILQGLKSRNPTYESVWEAAKTHAKEQHPKKTVIGNWFTKEVFR